MNNVEHNIKLLSQYLKGRFMSSFKFDNYFTLNFHADYNISSSFPLDIELTIMSEWWFGVKDDWDKNVLKYGKGVEPSEPILAYELALLRWSDNPYISEVGYETNLIKIQFQNHIILNISLDIEDENHDYFYFLVDSKSKNILLEHTI